MGRHTRPDPVPPARTVRSERPLAPSARSGKIRLSHMAQWSLPQRILGVFLLLGFVVTLVSTLLLWPSSAPARVNDSFESTSSLPQETSYGTVAVIVDAACGSPDVGRVFDSSPKEPATSTGTCTRVIVDLTTGPDSGKRTLLEISGQPGDPDLKVGDEIRLNRHAAYGGSTGYAFNDFKRKGTVVFWMVVTAVAMVVIGAWRGARSLVGLLITMAIIMFFMLPALLRGGQPILLAVTACAAILFLVIPLVHGLSWKAAAALAGTTISLGLAAVLAQWGIDGTNLRGLGDEDNLLVLLYLPDVTVHGLMLAGFIVGAIGALNDATVAQASTVNELAAIEPDAGPWRLFRGGMRVGRDHIASMLYTLVLSYTGAALPMLLLLTAAGRPLGQTLTSDLIATEIVRSAVGAIALALAVPITTLFAAFTVNPKEAAPGGHLHLHF